MDENDMIKWQLRLLRAIHVLYCSGALAAILFVILWLLATTGCASVRETQPVAAEPDAQPMALGEEIDRVTHEMRRAGCWAKDVSVSYTGPTTYVISVSGPYYEKSNLIREGGAH